MQKTLPILECQTIRFGKHHFPWHLHPNYYTCSLVINGQAILLFPDQVMSINAGDLLIIPPNLPHQTIVESHFTYRLIRTSVQIIPDQSVNPYRTFLSKNQQDIDAFNQLFDAIKSTGGQSDEHLNPEPVSSKYWAAQNTEPSFLPIETTLEFIHSNFTEPIKLNRLCEQAKMSRATFQRNFRRKTGISPMRYVMSLRIDKAKALMQTNTTLTEIAYATGFYDQSHFNRYFKSLAGMKPKVYASLFKNE